jgi:hypothetical protein
MNSQKDNFVKIDMRVLAKFFIILYLITPYIFFFLIVLFFPDSLSVHFKWVMSNWFNLVGVNLVIIVYWGPLLIIVGGVSYIARMSNLSRIPSNSSVSDAITLPTIQYGPLKIIFPIEEEELIEENEVSIKNACQKKS